MGYLETRNCRICKSPDLVTVLDLGQQALTGVFPKNHSQEITTGPLSLVWCSHCNLLQLKHSYSLEEMYGENYATDRASISR